MKTKFILTLLVIALAANNKLLAQAWSLNGNAGTSTTTNFIGTTDFNGFKIKTNNKVRVSIKSNGDLGIGTENPIAKLDVNGSTRMNSLLVGTTTGATGYIASIGGKLIAEEVRVDLKAAWPDYVFSSEYSLMPLEEVQQFINFQKHLPGLPDATEIKNNGIMLGDMQAKTIQKIEEEMLYILWLNDQNNQLKRQVLQMQEQINCLSEQFSAKNN